MNDNINWDLGKQIVEKQEKAQWGSGFIEQLSKDLKEEFPDMTGFSFTNLHYCRRFYKFYSQKITDVKITTPIFPQLGGKLQTLDNKNDTIGILLCKNKDNYEVEFSLKDINNPIGVSAVHYTELTEDMKAALPSAVELQNELLNFEREHGAK